MIMAGVAWTDNFYIRIWACHKSLQHHGIAIQNGTLFYYDVLGLPIHRATLIHTTSTLFLIVYG
jgi:hypothetical protein